MHPRPSHCRAFARLGLAGTAALVALLVLVPVAGAVALDTSRWAYYRQIDTSEHPDDLVRVKLDAAVWAGAREDLADLRVVDDQRQEVPSQVDFQQVATLQRDRWNGKVTAQKKGKADGTGSSSLDLDLSGPRPANHFYMTADGRDFWKQVTLQGSGDGKAWTAIPGAFYIYDFTSLGGGHHTDFTFPRNTYRFLRATMADLGTAPLTVRQAWAADDQITSAPLDLVPALLLKPPADPQVQGTLVICDLGPAAPPVQEITLDTPDRDFRRFVKIEASDDGATWQSAGEGAIYRYDLPTRRAEGLQLSFRSVNQRYLRLTMPNSGEGSLNITRVDAWAYPRYIKFRAHAGHQYTLYYGDFAATAPDYSVGSVPAGVVVTLPDTALGPQQLNPDFKGRPPPGPGNAVYRPGATGSSSTGTSGGLGAGALAGWSLVGAAGLGAGAGAYYLYTKRFGGGKGD